MILGVLLAIATGVLWAVQGVIFSRVVITRRALLGFLIVSSGVSAAGAAVLLTPWPRVLAGDVPDWPSLMATQLAAGLINAYSMDALRRALRAGHHGMVWTVSQTALVFPFLYALLVIGEPVRWIGVGGVAVIVVSLFILGRTKPEHADGRSTAGRQWLLLAIWCMVLFGAINTLLTVPTYWPVWDGMKGLRTTLFFAGSFLGFVSAGLVRRVLPPRDVMVVGVVHGLTAVVNIFVLVMAMDAVEPYGRAGVVYPLGVGVNILTFALYACVILRERSGSLGYLGAAATLAGVVLVAM
ncbi:MAG: hypothetical protein IT442_15115 [Phycisphaeraceae bacterium]|nr:hypothetical protein [Phycisphaeraceae bacterium]